jgi:branched-chain amino acid transport system substrate-binding protein
MEVGKVRWRAVVGGVVTGLLLAGQGWAQTDTLEYANTPLRLRPYGRFQVPDRYFFNTPQAYHGPGRDVPAPVGLREVKIGFLGPIAGSRDSSLGRRMLQGAELAVQEANAHGGFHGIPFRLVVRNDLGLWGASSNEMVALNEAGVWAVLGSIDGANTHIMLRLALKIGMPLVNSGDTDPTLTETAIPWLIRVSGDDRQSSYALVLYAHDVKAYRRIAVLRVNDRYGRVGTEQFKAGMQRLGTPVILELFYQPGETVFTPQLERIKQAGVDAVLVWGDADEAGRIVRQMREMNMHQAVLGSDRLVSPTFLELAGQAAEGTVATYLYNPDLDDAVRQRFDRRYRARFGESAETFAAHAYDGMSLLVDAIRTAGLNRVLIRDRLLGLKTYRGVTGTMQFDATHNDIAPIWMAQVRNGKFVFFPTPLSENAHITRASPSHTGGPAK